MKISLIPISEFQRLPIAAVQYEIMMQTLQNDSDIMLYDDEDDIRVIFPVSIDFMSIGRQPGTYRSRSVFDTSAQCELEQLFADIAPHALALLQDMVKGF